jgi:DNA-binding NtrC family response regulator
MQRVDVRVIAASNRNVEEEVDAGRFRKDLFYRLNAVSIRLPPLRERPEDILLLAKSFAERVYSLSPEVKFSLEALELLELYPWPGNIRELENAVVRATAICDGTIRVKDLPERVQSYRKLKATGQVTDGTGETAPEVEELTSLAVVEGHYVEKVLIQTRGNKQAAARILDVDRKTLDRMIKRHNLSVAKASSSSQAAYMQQQV